MEVGVNRFHIVQSDRLPQQLFVERQREASINVVAMEHRHAHDTTHEVEVRQVLLQNKYYINIKIFMKCCFFF